MAALSRYEEALQFLFSRLNYERIGTPSDQKTGLKLSRMRELLQRLGNPHLRTPIVHVAGTKGKGSTAAMIAAMLQSSGYTTGLFSSPHLYRVEERFVVNDRQPSEEELTRLIEGIRPHVEAMDRVTKPPAVGPTYFEITTAVAMVHFAEKNADLAVLEVGLGGRLDSTNVCSPKVAVITSISRDHTRQLGNSLAKIAAEKAGIVKPGVPVINGAVRPAAVRTIAQICAQRAAPLRKLGEDFHYSYELPSAAELAPSAPVETQRPRAPLLVRAPVPQYSTVHVQTWRRQWPGLRLAMLGRHQAANCAVAVAVVEQLCEQGWHVPAPAVAQGVRNARLPARVELLAQQPTVVIDAAHNGASIRSLIHTLRTYFPARRRLLVFATTQDKDVSGMLRQLVPFFDRIVATRYQNNPRGVHPGELAAMIARRGNTPVEVCDTPAQAWQCAERLATRQDVICVAGSFFIAAEMRQLILRRCAAPPTIETNQQRVAPLGSLPEDTTGADQTSCEVATGIRD